MSLHLYCIVPAGREPAAVAGVAGQPVDTVACGALACWVSAHDTPPQPTGEAVRAHHHVVSAAMDRTVTPVPLRFGQALADEAAVRGEVERDAARWQALLATFAGHVEYGVRVLAADTGAPDVDTARDVRAGATNTGTAYLAALARRHAAAAHRRAEGERIDALIQDHAAGLIRDRRTEFPVPHLGLVALAHLVAWERADDYHARLAALRPSLEPLRLVCTGPWPPWSFVA